MDDLSQVTLECFGSFALKICTKGYIFLDYNNLKITFV